MAWRLTTEKTQPGCQDHKCDCAISALSAEWTLVSSVLRLCPEDEVGFQGSYATIIQQFAAAPHPPCSPQVSAQASSAAQCHVVLQRPCREIG